MAGIRIWRVIERTWTQLWRDPRAALVLVFVPVMTLGLLGYALERDSTRTSIDVVPVGEKLATTSAASYLEQALHDGGVTTTRVSSLDAAARDVRNGRVQAYVVIDDQTAPAVFSGDASKIAVGVAGDDGGRTDAALAAIGRALGTAALRVVREATTGVPGNSNPPSFETTFIFGGGSYDSLDYVAPALLVTVTFMSILATTLVALSAERTLHTLERFMATALRRSELLIGYVASYQFVAAIQTVIVLFVAFSILHVGHRGGLLTIFAALFLTSLLALSFGLLLSSFAGSEAEAMQLLPLVMVPQVIIGGVLFPLASLPGALQVAGHLLPATYSVSMLRDIMIKDQGFMEPGVALDMVVMLLMSVLFIAVGARRLRAELADGDRPVRAAAQAARG